jgi:hypothetical protein
MARAVCRADLRFRRLNINSQLPLSPHQPPPPRHSASTCTYPNTVLDLITHDYFLVVS